MQNIKSDSVKKSVTRSNEDLRKAEEDQIVQGSKNSFLSKNDPLYDDSQAVGDLNNNNLGKKNYTKVRDFFADLRDKLNEGDISNADLIPIIQGLGRMERHSGMYEGESDYFGRIIEAVHYDLSQIGKARNENLPDDMNAKVLADLKQLGLRGYLDRSILATHESDLDSRNFVRRSLDPAVTEGGAPMDVETASNLDEFIGVLDGFISNQKVRLKHNSKEVGKVTKRLDTKYEREGNYYRDNVSISSDTLAGIYETVKTFSDLGVRANDLTTEQIRSNQFGKLIDTAMYRNSEETKDAMSSMRNEILIASGGSKGPLYAKDHIDWTNEDVKPYLHVMEKFIDQEKAKEQELLNADLTSQQLEEVSKSGQFLGFKQDHYKVTIQEAIKDAYRDGSKVIRFPTPMTISYIEGYVDETTDGEGGFLVYGDQQVGDSVQTHLGEGAIITNEYGEDGGYEIATAESGVREFTIQEFIDEEASNWMEDFEYNVDVDEYRTKMLGLINDHIFAKASPVATESEKAEQKIRVDELPAIEEELDNITDVSELMQYSHEKYGAVGVNVSDQMYDEYKESLEEDYDLALTNMFDGDYTVYDYNGTDYVVVPQEYGEDLQVMNESYATGMSREDFRLSDVPNDNGYQDIARKYGYDPETDTKGTFYKYLEKLRPDLREVTDENGNTWYESDITQEDSQPTVLFQEESAVYTDDGFTVKSFGVDGQVNNTVGMPATKEVTAGGNFVEHVQNQNYYLMHYEKNLTGENTVYEKLQTTSAGVKEMTEMLLESFEDQYKKSLKTNNLTTQDFSSYMKAKSIKDRLALISERRGENVREYAGWTEEKARVFLNNLTPDKLAGLQSVESWYRKIIDRNQRLRVQYGLDTQANIDMYNQREPNYVSWKEFGNVEDADNNLYYNPYGNSTMGIGRGTRQVQQALGRKTESGDVVTNLLTESGDLLKSVGQLNTERSLLNMITSYPQSKDDFDVNPIKYTEKLNPETGLVETVYDRQIDKDDLVIFDNVNLNEEGKPTRVLIRGKNEMAQRIIQQLRNERSVSLEGNPIGENLSKYMRFLSSMITMYNPEFALLTNPVRDFNTVMFQSDKYPEFQQMKDPKKKIVKNLGKAWKDIAKYQWGDDKTGDFALLREFGGKTGWTAVTTDYQKTNKHLEARLKNLQRKNYNPLKALRFIMDHTQKTNEVMENGIRLAVFRTLINEKFPEGHHIVPSELTADERKVIDRASFIAKNVSLDFNMKGNQTGWMKATWLFVNPAIQGAERTFDALKQKKVQKTLAGLFGFLTTNAMMQMLMMGDADGDGENDYENIPKYQLNTGVNVFLGDGKMAHVPLPLNLAMVNTSANKVAKYALMAMGEGDDAELKTRGDDAYNDLMDTLGSVMYSMAPVDLVSSDKPVEELFPTIIKPYMELKDNENFFGGRIYKENIWSKHPKPAPYDYKDSTNPWAVEFAQVLHSISGGDEETLGKGPVANIHPESLEYLFDYYGGGLASFARRLIHVPDKIKKDTLSANDVPFSRRFYKDVKDYGTSKRFKEYVDDSIRTKGDNMELFRKAKLYEKQVTKMWKQYSKIRKAKGKDEATVFIRENIEPKMKEFMKFYRSVKN